MLGESGARWYGATKCDYLLLSSGPPYEHKSTEHLSKMEDIIVSQGMYTSGDTVDATTSTPLEWYFRKRLRRFLYLGALLIGVAFVCLFADQDDKQVGQELLQAQDMFLDLLSSKHGESSIDKQKLQDITSHNRLKALTVRLDATKTEEQSDDQPRTRPVIGILSMPVAPEPSDVNNGSYFPANYVPFLKQSGADVVPVFYDMPLDKLDALLGSLNGILFTGGHLVINSTDTEHHPYMVTAKHVYSKVKELNSPARVKKKGPFPLWGTCQGFEVISVIEGGSKILRAVEAEAFAVPLETSSPDVWTHSNLFRESSAKVLKTLSTKQVGVNLHSWGVYPQDFAGSFELNKHFRVLAINEDLRGIQFVSIFEGRSLPIFGVQFHPEIMPWEINKTIKYDQDIVEALRAFSDAFTRTAAKNRNSFESKQTEEEALIDNYTPSVKKLFRVYEFPPFK